MVWFGAETAEVQVAETPVPVVALVWQGCKVTAPVMLLPRFCEVAVITPALLTATEATYLLAAWEDSQPQLPEVGKAEAVEV